MVSKVVGGSGGKLHVMKTITWRITQQILVDATNICREVLINLYGFSVYEA